MGVVSNFWLHDDKQMLVDVKRLCWEVKLLLLSDCCVVKECKRQLVAEESVVNGNLFVESSGIEFMGLSRVNGCLVVFLMTFEGGSRVAMKLVTI